MIRVLQESDSSSLFVDTKPRATSQLVYARQYYRLAMIGVGATEGMEMCIDSWSR